MVRKIANRPAVKRGTEVTYKEINTLRKSLQTTSASPYRTQVQPTASFLVCFLIFIE